MSPFRLSGSQDGPSLSARGGRFATWSLSQKLGGWKPLSKPLSEPLWSRFRIGISTKFATRLATKVRNRSVWDRPCPHGFRVHPCPSVVGIPAVTEALRTSAVFAGLSHTDVGHCLKPQVIYTCKQKSEGRWVEDVERGVMPGINLRQVALVPQAK
jgi:hypothetical protein